MSVIMERLAKLESFLKKSPEPAAQNNMTGGKAATGPDIKQNLAANIKGGKQSRGKNGGRLAKNGGRQAARKRLANKEQEEVPVKIGRKGKWRQRPRTPAPEPVYPLDVPIDMFETTTVDIFSAGGGPDFGAAVDQLFATGVDMPQSKPRKAGVARTGLKGGRGRQRKQRQKQPLKSAASRRQNSLQLDPTLSTKAIIAAELGAGPNQKLTDPLIDQISAKVAARISNSISQKLEKAKENIKKKDQNYAVHIIGDWIPPASEDSPPQMNMTVQVNRTNSKDLKVTAQGMTVEENTLTKKTIDTAKGKTSSVTVDPPKQNDEKKGTTAAPAPSKDVLTVTVAPHPMVAYPWHYMYPTTMPSWMSNQENENQQQYDPRQHMYPHYPQHPYPYPHAYPPAAAPPPGGENNASGNNAPPPYGSHYPPPHYPHYPPHYPHWGGGRSGGGGEAR